MLPITQRLYNNYIADIADDHEWYVIVFYSTSNVPEISAAGGFQPASCCTCEETRKYDHRISRL